MARTFLSPLDTGDVNPEQGYEMPGRLLLSLAFASKKSTSDVHLGSWFARPHGEGV